MEIKRIIEDRVAIHKTKFKEFDDKRFLDFFYGHDEKWQEWAIKRRSINSLNKMRRSRDSIARYASIDTGW